MKPDHNNEPLWLTSLRHNKQCFDMVLNIPFPQTHTLTNKQCALLCQAQQASCDGAPLLRATCLTQTIGPTEGYCRAYGGGYCSSCRYCKRLLFVTVIKAFNILKMHSGTSPSLLLWCCDTDGLSLCYSCCVFPFDHSSAVYHVVCNWASLVHSSYGTHAYKNVCMFCWCVLGWKHWS